VAQDALIHHLGEETCLRRQFVNQVGNIFLPLRGEGLLIPGASAKGNHDDLPLPGRSRPAHKWAGAEHSRPQRNTCSAAQEITPAAAEALRDISGEG
jgi:hypothetical protein